jgi:ABC-type multidrug transport system fused ATPase/permease subunit
MKLNILYSCYECDIFLSKLRKLHLLKLIFNKENLSTSHRLEALKKYADTIYVLEDGDTKIKGSHLQLLETDNFYSDYWKELA